MKNNSKSWGLKFILKLKNNHPSGLILALTLLMLPSPLDVIPQIPQKPLLKELSLSAQGQFFLDNPALYPVNLNSPVPWVSARGVYIVDVDSMVPLFTKNPDLQLRPASITKIMTALVAMDAFGSNDIVTSINAGKAIGKTIRLTTGEQISFENMLYGLLLESGNDAAYALAENYPGGYDAMIAAMNYKAQSIHLDNSTFKNVSGIDQSQHQTTARDLAILSAYAMENSQFAEIVSTSQKVIHSTDEKIAHTLENTNQLLGKIEGVLGIKTGWTSLAGENLVTYIKRNNHKIIIVVLGSRDRFGDTTRLIDWVFAAHQWEKPHLPTISD